MKNFTLSVATVLALSTFAVAGGDIAPVEPMVEEVAPAQDDSGFYIGGAYSLVNTSIDYHDSYGYLLDGNQYEQSGTDERDDNGYMLLAGYKFNQYVAIEGRYWGSMDTRSWSGSETVNGQPDGSWDYSDGDFEAWGIYVKPMYPVTETFDVYALLGYGNTSINDKFYNIEGVGSADLLDEDGFQWGIGASYAFTENLSLFADYVALCNDVDQHADWNALYNDNWYDYDTTDIEVSVYTVNFGLMYKF